MQSAQGLQCKAFGRAQSPGCQRTRGKREGSEPELREVKRTLLSPVLYRGREMVFRECVLWVQRTPEGETRLRYSAVLDDQSRTLLRVPLEEIEALSPMQKGEHP